MMPYYAMPIGLRLGGLDLPEVGFGYSREVVTDLRREQLGFDRVVLSDCELINDNHVGDQVLPARAWGVEHLDPAGRMEMLLAAGVDQFVGEERVEVLLDLVNAGRVTPERLHESVRRLLTVKFSLGLFDDPFVDETRAREVVGCEEFRAAGLRAQARSVTVLTDRLPDGLPLQRGLRIYAEGIPDDDLAAIGSPVLSPEEADVAIVRVGAPFEPRSDLSLETWFHQGSLDFPPGFVVRMQRIAAQCPLILDVTLDRPAILTPLTDVASVLTGTYGTGNPAYLAALLGDESPVGRLPVDLPRSMEQVRQHGEDIPGYDDPLFPFGHGLCAPAADQPAAPGTWARA